MEQTDMFSEETTVKKMCKKGAIQEIQHHLGESSKATTVINEIKEALKNDYGKAESDRVVNLAKLLYSNKYNSKVSEINNLEELYEEIYGEE